MSRATLLRILLASATVVALSPSAQQSRNDLIRRMQIAEDSRIRDSASLAPLREGMRSTDTVIQALAIRGLGRQEMPSLIGDLVGSLNSAAATVRVEVVNALAQSAPGSSAPAAARATLEVFELLRSRSSVEQDLRVRAAIVRSISRLQLTLPAQILFADSQAVKLLTMPTDSTAAESALLSLERLARIHTRTAPLPATTIEMLRSVVIGRPPTAISPVPTAYMRRLAFMSLTAAGRMDAQTLAQTISDRDPAVRRLTALALATAQGVEQRERMLTQLFSDSAQIVRLEVVRGWFRRGPAMECALLLRATNDRAANVALGAIDLLAQAGTNCPERERASISEALVSLTRTTGFSHTGTAAPDHIPTHLRTHALVALATLDPSAARSALPAITTNSAWVARMYAARAAATLRDSSVLLSLSRDTHGNVRSAAIEGLSRLNMRAADSIYVRSLGDPDYNVVRVAARALAQAPPSGTTGTVLFAALQNITLHERETSRDARIAILDRINDFGRPADSLLLVSYLRDFDAAVADRAAQILARWTGHPHTITPRRRPAADRPPVENPVAAGTRLRITRSASAGGGVFEIELWPGLAPYTVGRLVRLARVGYYNGLTFHRVAPNFVLQGGSPGANEYVGDGPFMRDEIWMSSHERGTLGISTRGRDTGDAQMFVNTVDNPRLDFDYTVFGRVVAGMSVVDSWLEGDVMERVEVIPPR